MQIRQEEIKQFIFADDIIVYMEKSYRIYLIIIIIIVFSNDTSSGLRMNVSW